MKRIAFLAALAAFFQSQAAGLSLDPYFTSHMVLQRGKPNPVCGAAESSAKVRVSFGDVSVETAVRVDGKWSVDLPPMEMCAEGRALVVECGDERVVFDDVVVGDVWLCSGQSNMEFHVGDGVPGEAETLAAAEGRKGVRSFAFERVRSDVPAESVKGGPWRVCTGGALEATSAVAYFFASSVNDATDVPVGIWDNNWGGCAISHYLPGGGQDNAMVNPVRGHPIAGIIWYQGESDWADRRYGDKLERLAAHWRGIWGADVPFYIVQLSSWSGTNVAAENFERWWPESESLSDGSGFAVVREAQRRVAAHLPRSGLVVTFDVGDDGDIHPRNKRDVGERAAKLALRDVYGYADIVAEGPRLVSAMAVEGEVVLKFASTGNGLVAALRRPDVPCDVLSPDGELRGFSVAEADGVYGAARAEIRGDEVVLRADGVKRPVSARYGYGASPLGRANLYNREGLPASPFATEFSAGPIPGTPDVFVGTSGDGHCTPGAAYPFGLVLAGPDTGTEGSTADEHQSGYQHGDDRLYRFSQLHINGTGCPSLGNLGILPLVEPAGEGPVYALVDKSDERGEPGYYAVRLADSDIDCETTVGAHTAAYRFAYPASRRRILVLDGDWGVSSASERPQPIGGQYIYETAMEFPSANRVTGFARIRSWTDYTLWWDVEFSSPVASKRTLPPGRGGRGETWELEFSPSAARLEVRIGISTVSAAGARRNLEAEMPSFAFDERRRAAKEAWDALLSRIRLDEGTDPAVAANFRAAMYRLFVQPCDIADAGAEPFYSTLSLWDTYRAAHPLYTILAPERVDGFIRSMLRQYCEQGYLPLWALMGNETHCMIGHHAVPVIVDAYLKGFRGFDAEEAYAAVKNSLTVSHTPRNDATWGLVKEDWPAYDAHGYVPFDGMEESYDGRRVTGESVSRTLECAYDDACAARFAAALGKGDDAAFFARRSGFWRNVFDPSIGFVRGRDRAGRWREPFDPYAIGHCWWSDSDFTEGNAWQWTWHVMQDPEGLVAAMGGREAFGARLASLFSADSAKRSAEGTFTGDVTGLIGQYAHGNEPSHHTAYFFRWSDRPRMTDETVRRIFDTQYAPRPDGLCGNDDCGQMAAWYVFSALGFYPFDPCGGEYVVGAPQVPGAVVSLPGGREFRVVAKNLSKRNRYVKSVTLNGRPVEGWKIRHADIMSGGELVFEMGE